MLEYKRIPIYYEDHGQGPSVILLHGFLETTTMWKPLVTELAVHHRVITIDLPGHGQTGSLSDVHTMEMMAQVVVHVLDQLQIETAIFIGHSMGGYVALALAEHYTNRVDGLCLMNSTPFADSLERQINRDRAIKVIKQDFKSFVSMAVSNLFCPEQKDQFIDAIASVKQEAMKLTVQGIVAALKGMKIRKDRSQLLRQLQIPKLVILGKTDPILDYTSLKYQLALLGIDTVDLPGGHMSYIENKEELTYIIKRFVEK